MKSRVNFLPRSAVKLLGYLTMQSAIKKSKTALPNEMPSGSALQPRLTALTLRSAGASQQDPIFKAPPGVRPSPFDYADYRDYLIGWLKYLKTERGDTVRSFAEQVGVASPMLVRVLKHWKPMEPEDFKKILDAIQMSPNEREFLEALHCMSDTRSASLRLGALRKMVGFGEFLRRHPREYEAWRYLSHWYYVAIREMSTQVGFRADAAWVRDRLRKSIPLAEVRKVLRFLEGAGFFEVLPGGEVKPLLKEVNCAGGIFRLMLGSFHREMLDLASESIQSVSAEKRLLLGRTITIPASKQEAARSILEEALERINQLGTVSAASDDVYHVELAMIPLTKGSEVD